MGRTVRIGVDVGGTFTDLVLVGDGEVLVGKLPSTPDDQSHALAEGVAEIKGRAGEGAVSSVAHGTTVATNAVLERRGARTGLITTDGFRDLLVIGRQQRPKLYDQFADRAEPIVARTDSITVVERVAPDGSVVTAMDPAAVRAAVDRLVDDGVETVAVCLLFSFANPDHERRVRDAVGGRARVSLSHEVLGEFREYERASTTALDAYVGPVVERYMANIASRVAEPVVVMRSGGGTMSTATAAREPVHTLLSGPAGGVRGAAMIAATASIADMVTFDMGGTSTDVCLVEDGEPAIASEASIGGLPFRTPTLGVHTVGAGGGSLLWVDDAGALRAGPRSAGAVPGPACYGRGGLEPAVTDAHAALGHLDADAFLGGRMHLDLDAARSALARVAERLGSSVEDVAHAGLDAARAAMAAAIRVVTVERGRDPRDLALVAFGGAGPMHGTALAHELGMPRVLVPPAAGVLSALGLLAAPLTADASRTLPVVDPTDADVVGVIDALTDEARTGLREQGAEAASIEVSVDCRYQGQAHEVNVALAPVDTLASRFAAEHRARFGWDVPGEPIEAVTFRVRASGPLPEVSLPALTPGIGATPRVHREVHGWGSVPVYARDALGAGDEIAGPCLVEGEESTVIVDDGWRGSVEPTGAIVLWTR